MSIFGQAKMFSEVAAIAQPSDSGRMPEQMAMNNEGFSLLKMFTASPFSIRTVAEVFDGKNPFQITES